MFNVGCWMFISFKFLNVKVGIAVRPAVLSEKSPYLQQFKQPPGSMMEISSSDRP